MDGATDLARLHFEVRPPRAMDQGYITSTWLTNLRNSVELAGMGRRSFFERFGPLVDELLDRSDTRCLVACDAVDRDSIWGWIVYTPIAGAPVLHFVYVRRKRRGRGAARELARLAGLGEGPIVYTVRGPSASALLARRPGAVHLPLAEYLGRKAT